MFKMVYVIDYFCGRRECYVMRLPLLLAKLMIKLSDRPLDHVADLDDATLTQD